MANSASTSDHSPTDSTPAGDSKGDSDLPNRPGQVEMSDNPDGESMDGYIADFLDRHKIKAHAGAGNDVQSQDETSPAKSIGDDPKRTARPPGPSIDTNQETRATDKDHTTANESPEEILAMRKLANSIAQGALETYSFARLIRNLRSQLCVAVPALLICMGMAATSTSVSSWNYTIAILSLLVAFGSCSLFFYPPSESSLRSPTST